MAKIVELREQFQQRVLLEAIFWKRDEIPSIADTHSALSCSLARGIIGEIGYPVYSGQIKGQTAGKKFEIAVRDYLKSGMHLLAHLRPGDWFYSVHSDISEFAQYQHLAALKKWVRKNREAHTALGDYVVKPDVIVARMPVNDAKINENDAIVDSASVPHLTPLRQAIHENSKPVLHASISCKLTFRSDRSQNARTEGLNLIRNRKGHTPHITVVTAEPMPTRIASLALGTGDIDCVYHFALNELLRVASRSRNEAVLDSLDTMVAGKRLRDIADLPFDLVV